MKAFNELMGYPMDEVTLLAQHARELTRKYSHIVELNKRDLENNGIEND